MAIVGARRASPYGLEMAYELGRGLGAAGVTVVSGLALGIDAAAHRGCLDAGGRPIAVLAGGPDVPYPRSNARPVRANPRPGARGVRAAAGAALVSVELPGAEPDHGRAVRHDVVVEAAAESGSLITATSPSRWAGPWRPSRGARPPRVARGQRSAQGRRAGGHLRAGPARRPVRGRRAPGPPPAAPRRLRTRWTGPILEAVEAGLEIDGICASAGLPVREVRAALARARGLRAPPPRRPRRLCPDGGGRVSAMRILGRAPARAKSCTLRTLTRLACSPSPARTPAAAPASRPT